MAKLLDSDLPQIGQGSRAKYLAYNKANPEVWRLFKKFTFEMIRRGRKRYSADAMIHRIRWEMDMRVESEDGFKINNNFTAHYARRFIKSFPEHADFFEIR